jgi:hypothetical protein
MNWNKNTVLETLLRFNYGISENDPKVEALQDCNAKNALICFESKVRAKF